MSSNILVGDALVVLRGLADESVQCCVTSPPYWGLRDYGTATWDGGDAGCDHRNGPLVSPKSTLQGYTSDAVKLATGGMPYHDICGKCGARRVDAQLGLERTPYEYVAALVSVFREVRRVLRDDGTLWLNLGDSYNSGTTAVSKPGTGDVGGWSNSEKIGRRRVDDPGLKPKDLVGIPWRVAFALQADGWWLRSDIIWAKPNPMPESVTDRPTKSHEYLFLLSKAARYYYDAAAIAEPLAPASIERLAQPNLDGQWGSDRVPGKTNGNMKAVGGRRGKALTSPRNDGNAWNENNGRGFIPSAETRNARTVWTIATQPFKEAHFATFPCELARRCIAAGTKPGDTVLDPFAGAGTTILVADRMGRDGIGIELNPKYAAMAEARVRSDAPLLHEAGS